MTVHLRFAARDPGGANVLGAFLRSSWFRASSPAEIWTMPLATGRFHGVPASFQEFPLDIDPAAIRRAWNAHPADVLVTATSHYEPFEAVMWEMAAAQGVPSLAVLDQWMNLGPRFARGRPAFVAALDEAQAHQLAALGFRDDDIIVGGNPWLAEVRRTAGAAHSTESRDESTVRVLFVSEPIASDVAAGYNEPFGFDEFESFSMLHDAAQSAARAGLRVELSVRCHPYEDQAAFQRRVQAAGVGPGVYLRFADQQEPPLARVLWADLVCGIGSTLLLEAMVVGRPVVSLQPGLTRENVFIVSLRGWAETLTDHVHGKQYLVSLLTDPNLRTEVLRSHEPLARTADDRAGAAIGEWLERFACGS